MMKFESSAVSWSRYWCAGNLDSCFTGDQTFSLQDKWVNLFSKLNSDCKILDLATGNGAVARIAANTLNQQDKEFSIYAVDQANIEPSHFMQGVNAPRGKIQIFPNTHIESLPFQTSFFDCVTSQFGFEYSNTDQTIREMARISKQDAVLMLIMHARNGEVDKASSSRLSKIKSLVAKGEVVDIANRIGNLRLRGQADTTQERSMLRKLQSKIDRWKSRLEAASDDDVTKNALLYLVKILSESDSGDTGALSAKLDGLSKELHAYIVRLNTMIHAAKAEEEIVSISNKLKEAGFTSVCHYPLTDSKGLIAWEISAIFQT